MYQVISVCKSGGYVYCRTAPSHPRANSQGLYPLHRVIMENKLNRALLPAEDVHHVDEDKLNNHPDNLEVLSKSEHAKKHSQRVGLVVLICPVCLHVFEVKPNLERLRRKRNKSGLVFCSRNCGSMIHLHQNPTEDLSLEDLIH